MRSASITLLCLALMLLTQVTYQINTSSHCSCLKTSDVFLRKTNIKSYTRQRAGICHIDAVVFKTVRSLTFCSDPKKPWVKDAMEYLDKKKAAAAIKTTAQPINSTVNVTSTTKTTSDLNTTARIKNC